jgi:predicted enzyme related to lactoylglutathione lyase
MATGHAKFYGQTFGWQLVPVPEMGYTMAMTGPTDPEQGPTERVS